MPLAIGVVGVILLLLLVLAVLAPWISPADPMRQVLLMRLKPPGTLSSSGQLYLLGTDDQGRDVLTRVFYGARLSLSVAVISVGIGLVVGVSIGLIAATIALVLYPFAPWEGNAAHFVNAVGATMGPLGDRLDPSLRSGVT